MDLLRKIMLLGLAAGLAGCEPPPPPALSPDFGHSVRNNMHVHIVGPNYAAPDMDGHRAAFRMEQYRTGKTTPVQPPGTTQTTATPTQPPPPGAAPGAAK
jgi:hypothetical protein